MKKLTFICILCLIPVLLWGQAKKDVSLEELWLQYRYYPQTIRGVDWTKDGQYYTSQKGRYIIKYDITSASPVDTLYGSSGAPKNYIAFDAYSLSPDENQILLATNQEGIYRRSSKSNYYVYNIASNRLKGLDDGGKQSNATFSPDGQQVAFVRNNNIFVNDLATGKTTAITNDGEYNKRINGSTDWVYEEEFSFVKAFFWSPDSKKIAFLTFDEGEVKEYNMQLWRGPNASYPEPYRYKYPKAGEDNSVVSLSIHDLASKKTEAIDLGSETDMYIPRLTWTQDANILSVRRMNRLQNKLEIIHVDVQKGESKVVVTDESETYVDLDFIDELTYLKNGKQFIRASEKDGYKHLYLHNMDGSMVRQITKGDWEVSSMIGIDEKNNLIYFTSPETSPLERHVYQIRLDGKGKKQLSTRKGTHRPDFSPDLKYYLDFYSSASELPQVSLHTAKTGKMLKVLEDNKGLKNELNKYNISYKEFMTIKAEDGTDLNAWMIKPQNFDASKKYPVLMFVYGGPGSQTVTDSWDAFNFLWYQILANEGYIIVSVDNRGTGARGEAFKKITYANLGKYETQDQIAAAQYLAKQSYVDSDRIGIWGWSYGGYMSSLSLMLGADIFKMAIAVAPVSTWRFYDTIYTERYLKRPQDNAKGYDDYSPITHVNKLKGKFLLVHGTGDDNVHFQNAVELQNALIRANKQFESFYYPNRAHGISGGNTRFHLYTMLTDFIKRSL